MSEHDAGGDDRELVRRTLAGGLESFDQLMARYETRVFQYLCFRSPSREDAEDLTQRTFLNAYRKLGTYKPAYPFRSWLFAIARNQAVSHLRRLKPQVNTPFDLADPRAPDHALADQEVRDNLWITVRSELSETQSTALWLAYKEELPLADVARVMGKTVTHVKVILHRGRKALATVLGDTAPAYRPDPRPEQHPAFAEVRFLPNGGRP